MTSTAGAFGKKHFQKMGGGAKLLEAVIREKKE